MAYEYVNPIKQFNFQINRVLTYGGCRLQPAGGDGKLILCPYVCAVESGMAYPCRKGGKKEALASCRLLLPYDRVFHESG